MDESALRVLLDNLDKSRSSLDGWMTFWTLLVVIGVVAEIAFVVHRHMEATAAWRRGIDRPQERPSRLWFLLELIAVGLVAAGVSGELAVEARTGRVETQITEANEQRSLLHQQQTSNAKQSAQGAADAAQRAKAAAAEAEAELNIVRKQVAAVSAKARTLDLKNNSLGGETPQTRAAESDAPGSTMSAKP